MATLQTYEVASRRHKNVVAIPWAEPAVPPSNLYPAFLEPILLKRRDLNRDLLELDQVTPINPFGLSGFYPASIMSTSHTARFDVLKQDLPELNQFPADQFQDSGFFPASTIAESNKFEYKVNFQQLPQLDQFTPRPGSLAGFYPGSEISQSLKVSYTTKLLLTTELDQYPATAVPEQPFTAYLEQPYFIKQEKRQSLELLDLNVYPQIVLSAALLPSFFNLDILFRSDKNRGLITSAHPPSLLDAVPPSELWTVQSDSSTTWSAQANVSTTWSDQADSSTIWTIE